MNKDSTTASWSRCSKRLAMKAASNPPAMLQSSHGKRSRKAIHGDRCAVPWTPINWKMSS